ncbi:FosX/FosE/FosI family fosfomycin resistance hydrolase [Enterococcus termitis]|uniref:FosX/FosE/FosI family fosfomycin resistance thiol transferase n=1 Tax=Enterococcus termitis TaxID=332950 RepID=A0A1E5H443_9ENTE|nr:FosX/FosE/FosI family fosfomycin resistance hydrolase [Enterococcus termitis]OEG19693.1 FosX/FosE/FosI family fosfomycin resistance thiol transferase [Enterococcus termitis]OJG97059.1 hypothetical protein RV18_GL001208 [Enterococcus termitis]
MIEGISHITFIVQDIEKSAKLFKEIFSAEEVYDSLEKNFSYSREKFFLISNQWIVLMEGSSLKEQSYNHLAFKIDESDYDEMLKKIKAYGLVIKEGRKRIEADSKSIYFYDYDNHLFEFHTGTLKDRLTGYNDVLKKNLKG